MSIADSKWNPISRSTLRTMLPKRREIMEKSIQADIDKMSVVSLTIDIWSDRKMRGFLGVTCHGIKESDNSSQLVSYLLSCNRFTGSHTREHIAEKFEEICERFDIVNKIDFVVTDNASNMRKAFSVAFDEIEGESSDKENDTLDNVDDPSLWIDVEPECVDGLLDLDCMMKIGKKQRLQCFAHTLQLAVGDGLKKESHTVEQALAKCRRLCTLLHTSCKTKEAFENEFGAKASIPADVTTRWNSTFRQVFAVVKLGMDKLNAVMRPTISFTVKDWSQLRELITILAPFSQATDVTQGEEVVTISMVAPCVLSLYNHLDVQVEAVRHLKKFAGALRDFLYKRFRGIFDNTGVGPGPEVGITSPFNQQIYLISAVLDPNHCLMWIEDDEVTAKIKQIVLDETKD